MPQPDPGEGPQSSTPGINWLRTLFLIFTPLISIGGIIYLSLNGGIPLATWVLAFVLYFLSGIAVSAGYHRLFSHRAYEVSRPIEALWLLMGAATFSNSALSWSADHRRHHRHADRENDPHNIKKGFLHAHVGWICHDVPQRYDNVKDLMKRPLVRLQHRLYEPIALLLGWGAPAAIASLWNDPWGGFIVAGIARVVIFHHCMFSINSLAHTFGTRTHKAGTSARDSSLVALLTFGEGYHNYHHAHPSDYRMGVRYYHYDPTKWVIWVLARLGLARDLRRASS